MNLDRKHLLPVILVILGIIDQSTDLLPELLSELNAPKYYSTLLRIFIISCGAIKLYLTESPKKIDL